MFFQATVCAVGCDLQSPIIPIRVIVHRRLPCTTVFIFAPPTTPTHHFLRPSFVQDPQMMNMMQTMQQPEYRSQMQTRMQALKEDPSLKSVLEELESGGPAAMMK